MTSKKTSSLALGYETFVWPQEHIYLIYRIGEFPVVGIDMRDGWESQYQQNSTDTFTTPWVWSSQFFTLSDHNTNVRPEKHLLPLDCDADRPVLVRRPSPSASPPLALTMEGCMVKWNGSLKYEGYVTTRFAPFVRRRQSTSALLSVEMHHTGLPLALLWSMLLHLPTYYLFELDRLLRWRPVIRNQVINLKNETRTLSQPRASRVYFSCI
ncbi:hypothetical protein ACRALDRAFT_205871 [Sodiomyces alcalophilus JCM 7366]|uniref:uncharacterized protein n=1 Tax=Sodiomyces alcalophilus JCM 7366 TaxID=591952 RepID=UPI0039B63E18